MKSFKKSFSTFVHSAVLLLLVLAAFSCKDDEDENPPRITILSPFENQSFTSIDTIEATATITDDQQLNSVELEILDQEFNIATPKRSYPVSGSTFEFGQLYDINAPELETGDYYLAFRAGDGTNVRSAFVKIKINAVPRELEGLVTVTSQGNQSYVHYREEGAGEFELKHSFFCDAIGAGLNFKQNILGVAGGESGNADFFEMEEYTVVESLPGFGMPGFRYYYSITFNPALEQFLVSDRDGRIRVLDKSAFVVRGFDGLINHVPLAVFPSADGYFVSEKEIDGPIYTLTSYSFPGLLLDTYPVSGDVKGVFDRNLTEKFVWVDDPEGLELRLMNTVTNLLSLPYERIGERLISVVRVDDNSFVISTSEGLLRYSYSNGGTVILDSSAPEGQLYFDDFNQLIYLADGQDVLIYGINGEQAGGFSFARDVVFVGFDYNR